MKPIYISVDDLYDPQGLEPYETIQQFLDMVKDVFQVELDTTVCVGGKVATRPKGSRNEWRISLLTQYERPHPDTVKERRAARKEARRATAWERSVKRAKNTLTHYYHNTHKIYKELVIARQYYEFMSGMTSTMLENEHKRPNKDQVQYMFQEYPRSNEIQQCIQKIMREGMPRNHSVPNYEPYKECLSAHAAFRKAENRYFRLEMSRLAAQTILNLVLQEKHN